MCRSVQECAGVCRKRVQNAQKCAELCRNMQERGAGVQEKCAGRSCYAQTTLRERSRGYRMDHEYFQSEILYHSILTYFRIRPIKRCNARLQLQGTLMEGKAEGKWLAWIHAERQRANGWLGAMRGINGGL